MHETSLLNCRHNAAIYSSSFFKACATRTDVSTAKLDRCARSFRAILPAVEKCFSDSAEEAGITRICFASLQSNGSLHELFDNHNRGSKTSSQSCIRAADVDVSKGPPMSMYFLKSATEQPCTHRVCCSTCRRNATSQHSQRVSRV